MIDAKMFKDWLQNNTTYSNAVIADTISRAKRADSILEWYNDDVYQFYLEREQQYQELSVSVRSQIKKAIKLYNCCVRA